MSESPFSESWYRVKNLRPEVRSHAQIHRHVYRGQDWYVLQDHSAGRYHRFSPEAYQIIGMMDGRLSLDQIWSLACERLGDNMPTQEEVIGLLGQLHRADALKTDIPPDNAEISERRKQERSTRYWGQIRSPLSIKIPLLDPERFLQATLPLMRPLLGWFGFALWGLVVIWALSLVGPNWASLTRDVADRVFAMENLILIWFIYPLVKIFHEFGHAYMVKKWGGEVHEMGVMFLVLMPIPYVEASASLAFRDKYRRMLVGAAGILVELFLAALALIAWAHMEPGPLRAVAYNILLICGVSTLLFNGNPLLRFDAYYVLSDLIEIPNLGARGNRYLGYLLQRYVIGVKEERSPAYTPGEARWMGCYALAAFIYKIFISVRIILFVAGKFFVIGILMAIWSAANMVLLPMYKITKTWLSEARLEPYRPRALALLVLLIGTLVLVAGFIPCPAFTVAEGIVWAPDKTRVYASANGFIKRVVVAPGSMVAAGDLLFESTDPELDLEVAILQAQRSEYEARLRASLVEERTEVEILRDEIARIDGELERALERRHDLKIFSPANGRFQVQKSDDLPDRFVIRGTLLGYVVDAEHVVARVVVLQEEIDQIRYSTTGVEARLSGNLMSVLPARIDRVVPAASKELPSMALSIEGGGAIALDPKSEETPKAFKTFFQFEISLPDAVADRIGERVIVRFILQPEPLVKRWFRQVRRVFLRYFAV